jgi:hypothetical protein
VRIASSNICLYNRFPLHPLKRMGRRLAYSIISWGGGMWD